MIVVYWLETLIGHNNFKSFHAIFEDTELTKAMAFQENKRQTMGVRASGIFSEMSNQVGKAGVSSVENGKTPDGHPYDWSKADRAGKMRKSDFDGSKTYIEP